MILSTMLSLAPLEQELQDAVLALQERGNLVACCTAVDAVVGSLVDLALNRSDIANYALKNREEVLRILSLAKAGVHLLESHPDAMTKTFHQPEKTLQLAKKRFHRICLACEVHP